MKVAFIVTLTNFWIWRIIKIDFLLGSALVILSITLIYLVNTRFNKKFFLIFLLLLILTSIKVLVQGFDGNFRTLTWDQQTKLNARHGYFAADLGQLFQNKISLRFHKDIYPYLNIYQSNVFNSLSPNLYFFNNHPREREKVEELSMYPSILIIPFLVGLVYFLKFSSKIILGYLLFALFIIGFVVQTYIFGPVLFFPLFNLIISTGFLKIYQAIKNNAS